MNESYPLDNILIVAGEASGDLLAAHLLQGLRQQGCQYAVWGVGGQHLKTLGMDCVESIDALAVRGYAEVLPALPRLWFMRRMLMSTAAQRRPKICITVDAPDFNLALAAKLKSLGIPTLHFISPSIWAWRRERLTTIKAAIDTMLCVFPHESLIYHQVGMRADYVGHPMAQVIPLSINRTEQKALLYQLIENEKQVNKHTHLSLDTTVVAILPGSRASEIQCILPSQLKAARLLLQRNASVHFVIPVATPALMPQVQHILLNEPDLPLIILNGRADLALSAADVGLIASGTATLEAALYRLPMVICYKMPYLSWLMMRHKNYLPWVGLPNILCHKQVVPELLQNHATPLALADAVWDLLQDKPRMASIREAFKQLHQQLRCDTQRLAARAVMRQIDFTKH